MHSKPEADLASGALTARRPEGIGYCFPLFLNEKTVHQVSEVVWGSLEWVLFQFETSADVNIR